MSAKRGAKVPKKETSPELSTLAADILNEMVGLLDTDTVSIKVETVKRLCGCVLSQDETKGQEDGGT